MSRHLPHIERDNKPHLVNFATCERWILPSAARSNKLLGRTGSVWQEEYFDTALGRSESLDQKMEYVRQSPVRAGLAANPEDYEWIWKSPRPRAAAAPQLLVK